MDVYRQPAAMDNVRLIIELLEQLSIKHPHEEAEGAVIVRDYGKDRRFLLADAPQLQFIVLCDAGKTLQIELFQAGDQGNLDGFQGFAAAGVIAPVILQGDMLRIPHFQPFKEDIQRGLVCLVVLPDFPGADHLHDHREVLLLRRGLVVQVEDERQQEHSCRLIPERVLTLRALRCGVLEEVRHQTLDIVVAAQIHKRVVAMAFLHVDEIQHLDVVPLGREKVSGITQKLTLRVKHNIAGICLTQVWFGEKPCFSGAGAAADQRIQIAPVFASVQPDGDILREDLVSRWDFVCVLSVHLHGRAPLGGAVLLPPPVIALGGEVYSDGKSVAQQQNEDRFQAVLTERDVERAAHRRPKVFDQPGKSILHERRNP